MTIHPDLQFQSSVSLNPSGVADTYFNDYRKPTPAIKNTIQNNFLLTLKGRKLYLLLCFVLLVNIRSHVYAQTIRYSRQTVSPPPYDRMQLIPGLAGNYQLLFYKKNKAISVYHFNADMLFTGKTELPVRFMDSSDIRIIPFKSFYLLYAHKQGSSKHELWKINSKGDVTPLSSTLQHFIDTSFKKNTSTLLLINQEEKLVIISHTYYAELKILSNSIIKVDENFKTIASYKVSFGFDRYTDHLHQAMLMGENLFLLESTRDSVEYALQLIKADLPTGKLFRKTFNSKYNFTRNAAFRFTNNDSAILVNSSVGQQAFLCKLDNSLNEIVPSNLVNTSSNKNSFSNFLLVDDETQQWLPMLLSANRAGEEQNSGSNASINSNLYNPSFSSLVYANNTGSYNWGGAGIDYNLIDRYTNSTFSLPSQKVDNLISFSIADKQLQLLYDTVITNKKGSATIFGTQYANVLVANKSYLLLKQEFAIGKNGLLLVYTDSNKQISTKDISVNPKYEYFLSAAQTIKHETLVMPYQSKSEIGLLKLSFSEMEN